MKRHETAIKNIIPGLVNLQKNYGNTFEGTTIVMFLPSGKPTKNYGKSPLLMGKSTMSMAIFNSKLFVYQRVMARHYQVKP